MIETTSDVAVFGLFIVALIIVAAAVFRKAVEKVGQSLRGWMG